MTKPFNVSKMRKGVNKSIPGLSTGFRERETWISTGNYTLNKLISGDFNKGIPLGKVSVFAGESGSGKSFICSGNIIKDAQKQGIFVVLMDSENALDRKWLEALGVDTSDDKLLKINIAMIDDVAKIISDFMKEFKLEYPDKNDPDNPKVLFVADSLGMMITPTDVSQFEKGDLKGDMGRKPKALMALVRNCVIMFADYDIGLLATNHTYASQDMFDPDPKIAGGQGFTYASSILVAMQKLKLKEDEAGNKTTEVRGIRAKCRVVKTRFAKPFGSVYIKIPYDTGMSPYSGLVGMCESAGILTKSGNRWQYNQRTGEPIIKFRKAWEANEEECLDLIMMEWDGDVEVKNDIKEIDEAVKVEEIDEAENIEEIDDKSSVNLEEYIA